MKGKEKLWNNSIYSQKLILLRWVHSYEIQNGPKELKTRLVAKGFQEENNAKSVSPTCSKQSLGLIFNVDCTIYWHQQIDITFTLLQSRSPKKIPPE